ncbi:MAG TPA: LUD domain-containing protein [Acidobacteriaceae bacterium]|nr:LUD domain-containing protein [Acidobacteriaceae bacterium]
MNQKMSGAPLPASREPRAEILRRIGEPEKTPEEILAEYSGISREYNRAGSLGADGRLQMLEDRLREYDAVVYRAHPQALPEIIAQILTGRGKARIAVPRGIPAEWLPAGFEFVLGEDSSAPELDAMDGVLSGCTVAIAATGTLVLQNVPGQGARKLSLVPDYHLCIVASSQVVETVPEGFAALEQSKCSPTTLISGPSATADIEMTRIKGVHGPRFLDVVLIA